jgi:Ca2+-binding EF-hand superfamily protein
LIFIFIINKYSNKDFNENNLGIFRSNFIEHFRNRTDYYEIKSLCEKLDTFNNGLLSKIEFCNVLRKFSKDYEDEDIMKFLRVSNLLYNNKVKYSEFLDFIYYNPKNDQFSEIIENLKNLYNEVNNNIEALFAKITGEEYIKTIGKISNLNLNSKNTRSISILKMYDFLKKNYPQIKDLNKNVVCKLDLDLDGKISIEDLNGIIERYVNTFFFKRENKSDKLEVNLYPSEFIDEEKFKTIVKDIKAALKAKNLNEIGLFNKLDTNNNGFITHADFNKKIDEIINLAPGMKDKFFSFLDIRKLGLVDLDTFMKRFKEFKSSEVIGINNWDTEEMILNEFSQWLKQNHRVSENELFTALDYDSDGIIGANDFKTFLLKVLNFTTKDFNDFQLERILQHISLTKNKNICLIDLHEFILKNKTANYNEKNISDFDLVQPAKNLKENKDWINNVFEKIGSFISENYKDIESFFNQNSHNGKMTLEDLQNYFKKNYTCLDGFNLTYDEIVTLFSALDSQKKTYVLLEDLKSKLGSLDFYTKMHLDIKHYISTNFVNGIAAFKYFKQKKLKGLNEIRYGNLNAKNSKNENFTKENFDDKENNIDNYDEISNIDKDRESILSSDNIEREKMSLTKKEIFDGLNNLFPKKYKKETRLNYIKKNFKNIEDISFSEFNYVYFDDIKLESSLRKTITSIKNFKDKTMVPYSLNNNPMSKTSMDFRSKSVAISDNFSTKNHNKLETPFDEDSLEKIRRIIYTSRFDFTNYFKMHELLSRKGMVNQFEFKNMLKKMNIGITGIEIDQITAKAGKTRNGMVSIKDFVKFLKNEYKIFLNF